MSANGTPANVGSNGGLGPTLKPDGWAMGERYYPEATTQLGNLRFGAQAERYTAEKVRALLAERVEEAFRDGYSSRETYNDKETSSADDQWASAKARLLRA